MHDLWLSLFDGFTPGYDVQTILYYLGILTLMGMFYRLLFTLFRGFMR